jgi:hypothetical protein
VSVAPDAELPSVTQWLSKHGCLLRQLHLQLNQQQQQQQQQQCNWLQPLSGLTQLTSLSISNMR